MRLGVAQFIVIMARCHGELLGYVCRSAWPTGYHECSFGVSLASQGLSSSLVKPELRALATSESLEAASAPQPRHCMKARVAESRLPASGHDLIGNELFWPPRCMGMQPPWLTPHQPHSGCADIHDSPDGGWIGAPTSRSSMAITPSFKKRSLTCGEGLPASPSKACALHRVIG